MSKLCKTTREARLNQRLHPRSDAPFQKTLVRVFNLVPSGRSLMAVRTTSVSACNIFVETRCRPDELTSRSDALKLIRVL
jgi:hypothetical protein